eukprot:scaffold659_cov192-Ochromonas_danica.AAC.24
MTGEDPDRSKQDHQEHQRQALRPGEVPAHVVRLGGVACRVADPNTGATPYSDHAYHHLTSAQLTNIMNVLNRQQWGADCGDANESVGAFYQAHNSGFG